MMSRTFLFILSLFLAQSAQSCINEYRALLNGEIVFADADHMSPRARLDLSDKALMKRQLREAESIYKSTGNLWDYSDLATMYVYNGQYEKAKKIFLEIELKSPGRYITAANLGTTYELLGQNELALHWIRKAMAIDPNSHEGSEWIHVKILEAKTRAKGNEGYLWTHSILNLDFGNEEIPVNKAKLDLIELRSQIYLQLNERMSFIHPKDPVVAQLLIDLGNIVSITMDATGGFQIYQTAKEYGASSALFEKRYAYLEDLQSKVSFRNGLDEFAREYTGLAIIILLTLITLFVIGMVRLFRWIRKRRKQNLPNA